MHWSYPAVELGKVRTASCLLSDSRPSNPALTLSRLPLFGFVITAVRGVLVFEWVVPCWEIDRLLLLHSARIVILSVQKKVLLTTSPFLCCRQKNEFLDMQTWGAEDTHHHHNQNHHHEFFRLKASDRWQIGVQKFNKLLCVG